MMISQRLRSLIPAPLKKVLREVSHLLVMSDLGSLVTYYRVNHPSSRRGELPRTVELRIRQLHGRPVTIRTRGTDARVVFDAFVHRFHLPPEGTVPPRGPSLVFDLGSNIGCTMAHLACVYPDASIVGVELDADNAAICRKNIAPWSGRCELREAAVWSEDGRIEYEHVDGAEDGFSVTKRSNDGRGELRRARAVSIDTLLEETCGPERMVDYMKIDIEGAERDVLRSNTAWASRVRCIKVELHGGYTSEQCIADLERLGFRATEDTHHAICVVGVRHG